MSARACRAGASWSSRRPACRAIRPRTSLSATPCCTAPSPAKPISRAWRASVLPCATPAPSAVVEGTGDHGCEYMTGGVVAGAGQDRAQFRRRHVGRRRLCLRSRTATSNSAATSPWSSWRRSRPATAPTIPTCRSQRSVSVVRCGHGRSAALRCRAHPHPGGAPPAAHRQRRAPARSWTIGTPAWRKFVKVMPTDYAKALTDLKARAAIAAE